MERELQGLVVAAALFIFLMGGIKLLFKIIEIFINNWEKEAAIPVFVATIAAFIGATLTLGYYLPRWIS